MSLEPTAELRDAAVRFQGRTVWRDANIAFPEHSFTVVLGPNGAGKTTLLRVLLGLMPLSSGTVRVLGHAPHRGSRAVGYVPQQRTLNVDVPVRGRDLVSLGLDGVRWGFRLPGRTHDLNEQVDSALKSVDAIEYADRAVANLSGGEQQRLLLAQALVSEPKLLLLDEPLASLDVRNQAAVAHLVAELTRTSGVAAIMVSHDVNPVLGLVDAVAIVARQRVVAGRPEEIITSEVLSDVYGTPIEVLRDSRGRVFVVGLEEEVAHPHVHAGSVT